MPRRGARLALVGVLVGTWLGAPGPASAACHAFEVEVEPAEAVEGSAVEVRVSRDAAVNPSSVRVRTVDGTAVAGEDYEAVDRRIQFTAETAQTFVLATAGDDRPEPTESFRIELLEGDGCQINPNFAYDEATVTVTDDDEAASPTTAAPRTTSTTTAGGGGGGGGEGTSSSTTPPDDDDGGATSSTAPLDDLGDLDGDTSTTEDVDATDDPEVTDDDDDGELVAAAEDDDDGNAALTAVAVLLVLAGAIALGYLAYRRRALGRG